MTKIHIHNILPYTFNCMVKSPDGKVVQEQLVRGQKGSYKVIYNDDVTVVILSDGTKGIAKRNPADPYKLQVGHDIAHARASIKQLEKQISDIIETGFAKDRRIYW